MRPAVRVPSPIVANGVFRKSFLGETEGPFLGADLRARRGWSGGSAGGGSVGGGVRLRFEPVDEPLEDGLELRDRSRRGGCG